MDRSSKYHTCTSYFSTLDTITPTCRSESYRSYCSDCLAIDLLNVTDDPFTKLLHGTAVFARDIQLLTFLQKSDWSASSARMGRVVSVVGRDEVADTGFRGEGALACWPGLDNRLGFGGSIGLDF